MCWCTRRRAAPMSTSRRSSQQRAIGRAACARLRCTARPRGGSWRQSAARHIFSPARRPCRRQLPACPPCDAAPRSVKRRPCRNAPPLRLSSRPSRQGLLPPQEAERGLRERNVLVVPADDGNKMATRHFSSRHQRRAAFTASWKSIEAPRRFGQRGAGRLVFQSGKKRGTPAPVVVLDAVRSLRLL